MDSLPRWLALIAAAAVGVWCSYPAVFPAGAGGDVARRPGHPQAIGPGEGLLGGLLRAGGRELGADVRPLRGSPGKSGGLPHRAQDLARRRSRRSREPWRLPWWLIRVHTGMMLAYPQGGHNFGSAADGPAGDRGGSSGWRGGEPAGRCSCCCSAPCPWPWPPASLQRYPYGTSTRVMLYMAPAFCLLAAEGLMAVLRLRHRTAARTDRGRRRARHHPDRGHGPRCHLALRRVR